MDASVAALFVAASSAAERKTVNELPLGRFADVIDDSFSSMGSVLPTVLHHFRPSVQTPFHIQMSEHRLRLEAATRWR